jgi:hypothetical protein
MQYQMKGLEKIKNLCQEELRIVVLIFVLLYADDTIRKAQLRRGKEVTFSLVAPNITCKKP